MPSHVGHYRHSDLVFDRKRICGYNANGRINVSISMLVFLQITGSDYKRLKSEEVQEEKHFPRLPVLEINALFPVRMPKIILQTIGSGFLADIN